MFSDLSWLGIMVCIYAFSRLLHYVYLRLEDSNKHTLLQKVLLVICFLLWILSAPVSIVFYLLNTMHYRRLEDNIRKEVSHSSSPSNHSSLSLELVAFLLFILVLGGFIQNNRLTGEIESLESHIEELSYEYDRGFEDGIDYSQDNYWDEGFNEGYASGYPDGYVDGCSEGQKIGFAEGYYLGYWASVVDYADSNTNQTLGTALITILQTHEDDAEAFSAAYEWVKNWRYSHFGR